MVSAEEAISRLKDGNRQYVSTDEFKADISSAILEHFARKGQEPYAIIVGCSDSRVIPERIFLFESFQSVWVTLSDYHGLHTI